MNISYKFFLARTDQEKQNINVTLGQDAAAMNYSPLF